jgi:hypothetical protein
MFGARQDILLKAKMVRCWGCCRGLIVIGALAAATAVFGFIVSCARGCCLTVYLTLGVLVTLAQAGFTLYLFIAPQNAVDKLVQQKGDKIDE